jgi:hypothetical protein
MDGHIGPRTLQALEELFISFAAEDLDSVLIQVENIVQQKFPEEFKVVRSSFPMSPLAGTQPQK